MNLNYKPQHDFLIGIDSDGCVFNTMELKQNDLIILSNFKMPVGVLKIAVGAFTPLPLFTGKFIFISQ
jgi:hypothetical protein